MNSALRDCFADYAVNPGREQEIDLVRVIPKARTVIERTPVERIYEPIPLFFNIVIGRIFDAPMFLLAMGVCLHFSRCKDSISIIKRGLASYIKGLLLKILNIYTIYDRLCSDRRSYQVHHAFMAS